MSASTRVSARSAIRVKMLALIGGPSLAMPLIAASSEPPLPMTMLMVPTTSGVSLRMRGEETLPFRPDMTSPKYRANGDSLIPRPPSPARSAP